MGVSALTDTVYQQKRSKELIDSILTGKGSGIDYSGSLNELNTMNPNTASLYGKNVNYANASANKFSASGGYFEPMASKEDYIGNLTSKITDMFNQQESAVTQEANLGYENTIGALDKARANVKEDSMYARRDAQAKGIMDKMDLERRRNEMGLTGGGEALSNEVDIDVANEENANKISLEVIKQLGDIEGQKVTALRNKDAELKIAITKLGGQESEQLLSAYKEAENYNITKLNEELTLAKTGLEVRDAILQAEERQKTFEEQIRQFNVSEAENKRQFEVSQAESKRQFNITSAKSGGGGSSGGLTAYQVEQLNIAKAEAKSAEEKKAIDLYKWQVEQGIIDPSVTPPPGTTPVATKQQSVLQKPAQKLWFQK